MPEQRKITISIPIPSFSFGKSDQKKPLIQKRSFLKRTIILTCVAAFFLILFYIFSVPVKEDMLKNFDFASTVRLQNHIPLRFDPFLSAFSILGNFETTAIILFLVLFLTMAIRMKSAGLSHKTTRDKLLFFIKHPMSGLVVFFVFCAAHIVEVVGKLFLDHPGPPHMFLRTNTMNFPQLYVHTNGSYPSGHSMRMIFLLIVISFILFSFKKIPQAGKVVLVLILMGYAAVMLTSRVSLGEHWTTDVIGGSLLGSAFGIFALIFL